MLGSVLAAFQASAGTRLRPTTAMVRVLRTRPSTREARLPAAMIALERTIEGCSRVVVGSTSSGPVGA